MTLPRPLRPRGWTLSVVLALLAALHVGLAWWGIRHTGVTNDETAHLTAGYSYWRFNDYRLQPENGNLPQRWAGLAILSHHPKLDPNQSPEWWAKSEVWQLSNQFFFQNGNPIDTLLQRARTWMLVWPLAIGGLVFCWSRQLWGTHGALLSTALFAVSPTVLANGPLITSDTTAAFWLLLASWCWWRCLKEPGFRTIGWSLFATGVAFIAKFSCVLLVPTFGVMAVWHLGTRWGERTSNLSGPKISHETWRILGLAILHGLGIWLLIWLAFGLRFSPVGEGMPPLVKYFTTWEKLLEDGGSISRVISTVREWQLLPEAYIEGFAFVRSYGIARDAFLFGDFRSTGWWWFFPATFLLKSTIAELFTVAAIGGSALMIVTGRKRIAIARWSHAVPLLALFSVYGTFALLSTLNIGHRHILPLYPVLFITAGGLVRNSMKYRGVWLVVLPLVSLIETLSVAPHYLTFFNRPSGGPSRAWTKLVDSSLDWGQGLPALATWMDQNRQPGEKVYVSLFGNDSIPYRLPDVERLSPTYEHFQPRTWAPLEPGLYCISATMLQDVYSPFHGEWDLEKESLYRNLRAELLPKIDRGELSPIIVDFGRENTEPLWFLDRLRFNRLTTYLKLKEPLANVANSILVYRLAADELSVVTAGTPTELADLIALTLQERTGQ